MTSRPRRVQIGDVVLDTDSWDPHGADEGVVIDYIDIGSVDQTAKRIIAANRVSAREAPSRARQLVRADDVLVSTVRPNLNAVALVPPEYDHATASTGFTVLRADARRLSPRYLFRWVTSPVFVGDMTRRATGASYPAVSDTIVKESEIPLPAVEEQDCIAAILDRADAIRGKRREALDLTTELLRSAFLDVFGDPVANAKGWPVLRIEDLFPVHRAGTRCGPFGSALNKSEYEPAGIPVWGIDNVLPDRFIEEGSLFISEPKFGALQGYSVENGDILISRAGTVGRMCVARPRAKRSIIGTNLIRLSLDVARVVPEYFTMLLTLFGSRVTRLKANSKENAYSFLNTGALKELEIPVPDIQSQRAFFTWVEKVRKVQIRMEIARSETEHLFNSLAQRAFSGEPRSAKVAHPDL